MSNVAEAVSGVVDDLFGGPVEAEVTPNGPTDAAAETPQDAALELPALPELPDDLAEFLDEPDFDDEPAAVHDSDDEEWQDPENLARELAKAKKQLAFAEQKRAEVEKRKWTEEAAKYFPLADAAEITATSRRGFLKAARSEHERVAKKLAPMLQDVEAAKEAAVAKAYAEAKEAAAAQWGKPNVSGAPAPIEGVAAADNLERARASRNLASVAKALIQGNNI